MYNNLLQLLPMLALSTILQAAVLSQPPKTDHKNTSVSDVPPGASLPAPVAIGSTEGGFHLSCSISGSNLLAGQPVTVEIEAKNVTTKPKEIVAGRPEEIFDVDVVDVFGHKVPRTQYGQSIYVEQHGHFSGRQASEFVYLASGQSTTYMLDLGRLYDLSESDTYRVTVSRMITDLSGKGYDILTTGPAAFTIAEPPLVLPPGAGFAPLPPP